MAVSISPLWSREAKASRTRATRARDVEVREEPRVGGVEPQTARESELEELFMDSPFVRSG